MQILQHRALPLGLQLISAPYKEAFILEVTPVLESPGVISRNQVE